MRAPRTARLLAAATVTAVVTALAGAAAAQAVPVPVGPTHHLVLELGATDAAALTRLAHATGLTQHDRLQQLAALTPTAAIDAVRAQLAGLGLTSADDGSGFDIPVSGPAAVLDRLFPAPTAGFTGVRAVPSWLPSVVRVVDADDTTPLFHPEGTPAELAAAPAAAPSPDGCGARATAGFQGYVGLDLTSEYGAPTPACTLWSGDMTTPIIATIQYSGWNASDADVSARAQTGISNAAPSTNGQITSVGVNRSATYNSSTDGDGDEEVSLDVESILRTAPTLRQRVYVAPNNSAGESAAYAQILSDIKGGLNITVVSTSWGGCEQLRGTYSTTTGSYTYKTSSYPETAIQSMVAAGPTFFAASGDAGAYDCNGVTGAPDANIGGRLAVDYPASSPSVVGVGGTTWPVPGSSSRTETAWSDSSTRTGSGGGFSSVFATPSWQATVNSNAKRAVPDLAVIADASTGVRTYASSAGSSNGYFLGGGTSVSAPALAGMFESEVLSLGQTAGLHDVHPTLYQGATAKTVTAAASSGSAYTDVTAGNNLSYSAGPGYDEATGLGTPRLNVLGPALVQNISATSGAGQSEPISTAYPTALVATVTTGGSAAAGVAVTFSVASASATLTNGTTANGVSTLKVTTGSNGQASANLTAGSKAGAFTVTATAPSGNTAVFTETVTVGPASQVTATSGSGQSADQTTAFAAPLAATVTDAGGNPVSGVSVVFTVPSTGPTGTFPNGATTSTATTSAAGLASSAVLTAGSATGGWTVVASIAGAPATGSFALTTTVRTAIAATAGSNQSATAGATFGSPLQATVTDANGTVVAGAAVTFTLPAGVAAFSDGSTTRSVMTNGSGVATSPVVMATTRGSGSATATVSGTKTVSFALTVLRAPAQIAPTPRSLAKATTNTASPKLTRGTTRGKGRARQSGSLPD